MQRTIEELKAKLRTEGENLQFELADFKEQARQKEEELS